MGSAVHAIANPLGTVGSWVGAGPNTSIGKGLHFLDASTHPLEQTASDMLNAKKPEAPGINSNLARVQREQNRNAMDFRQNLPSMANTLGTSLADQNNQMMDQNIRSVRQNSSARGLLYGGLNAGREQGARSVAGNALAQGRSNINMGLQNAANTLDAQALHTAQGVQQTQDSIQSGIYKQALADMQARNAVVGGFMSGAGKVGGAMMGGV
jgi:hypothetical protein